MTEIMKADTQSLDDGSCGTLHTPLFTGLWSSPSLFGGYIFVLASLRHLEKELSS